MSCKLVRTRWGNSIVCGPDKCKHDDKGETYVCINDEWVPKTQYFPKWMNSEQMQKHIKNNDLEFTGESASCSKCSKTTFQQIRY